MGEKLNAFKGFLFESLLQVSVERSKEVGIELIKEATLEASREIGASVLLDVGSSMIPAIGPAISNFKTNMRIKNLEKMLSELNKRHDELSVKFESHSESNKEILDNIFSMVVEKISSLWQDEKIEYMINGYSELLEVENPSFDTAYLYFDTLDKLTILDIEALKLSYNVQTIFYEPEGESSNYIDILNKFDIDYSQYNAVRQNLFRIGLLENEYDKKLDKDIDNLVTAVSDIRKTVASLQDIAFGKRSAKISKLSSKSQIKMKAKDRLKISKFGRDFISFFIAKDDDKK